MRANRLNSILLAEFHVKWSRDAQGLRFGQFIMNNTSFSIPVVHDVDIWNERDSSKVLEALRKYLLDIQA